MKTLKFISSTCFIVMLLGSGFSHAEPSTTPIEKLIIDMADTPSDHQAISDFYKQKAADERAAIPIHKKMQQAYAHNRMGPRGQYLSDSGEKHCKKLIKLHESAATEYEALAALHDNQSKK